MLLGFGFVSLQVSRATTPERQSQTLLDFASMRMRVDEVIFPAADGVELNGWWIPADRSAATIVLCHAVDQSKRSMLNLAMALRQSGFSVLLFDFRGHGTSAGTRSSLGMVEKRDLLGALDWLDEREEDAAPIGVFGAGMGAHVAVLAAAERRQLDVLVLDGLYPDVQYDLIRRVSPDHQWARSALSLPASAAYFVIHGTAPRRDRAADQLSFLGGRDLLLLAPANDSLLTIELQQMVQLLPEDADSDGNLVVVPATLGEGLYGDQLQRYHDRVADFFVERLRSDVIARVD
jgi:alpha/beta superfamily hydrolase